MSRACTPVLVGVASPVSEILLFQKDGQISLMLVKKFNRLESAQKIYASRG